MEKYMDGVIKRLSDNKINAQAKRLKKIMIRAQKNHKRIKEESIVGMIKIEEKNGYFGWEEEYGKVELKEPEKTTYEKLKEQVKKNSISDNTLLTYFEVSLKVLKEVNEKFGIREFRKIEHEHLIEVINDRIEKGQAASTIRKVVHSMKFVDDYAVKTYVYKTEMNMFNYKEALAHLKEQRVRRRSSDSTRMKATYEQAEAVIDEMEKHNADYARIARYQLMTGFRISDAIRQKAGNISENSHVCQSSKGGLTNVIYVNHHTTEDKEFIDRLLKSTEKETGRIFKRKRDDFGHYISDRAIARAVTQLASRCAKKLDIQGENGETFSSHSFRGAFAHQRMLYYAKNKDRLDIIIQQKIDEQPRLRERYQTFEKRIKNKLKPKYRSARDIHDFEKVQWLISTDLNHSRQDVVRYYVPLVEIKEELKKYKK